LRINNTAVKYATLRLLGVISGFESNDYFNIAYKNGLLKNISLIYAKLTEDSKIYALLLIYNIICLTENGLSDFLNYPKLFRKILSDTGSNLYRITLESVDLLYSVIYRAKNDDMICAKLMKNNISISDILVNANYVIGIENQYPKILCAALKLIYSMLDLVSNDKDIKENFLAFEFQELGGTDA
jgi:hypothetical protein